MKKTDKKETWILVNVGTPASPAKKEVRKYLREFLNDPLVIDIRPLLRMALVNFIIVPFRAPQSAKKYHLLWKPEGSPLLFHLKQLAEKLEKKTGGHVEIHGLMRYGEPSLEKFLDEYMRNEPGPLSILPLYPQFADSTTGSVKKLVAEKTKDLGYKGPVRFIDQFYDHLAFIESWHQNLVRYDLKTFDHVLFSYHGLPLRQVQKCHPGIPVHTCSCPDIMPDHGKECYRASCYETTRIMARKLELAVNNYSTSFQSRLSKNWLKPFTDRRLVELARAGVKNILVVPASFVADCLETTIEIEMEYHDLFIASGGKNFVMAQSLNASDNWVNGVYDIIRSAEENDTGH
ncbi:MAG: ferrochelatase [Bacteroidales bacterium]|nr:ferrochelatase [Bacteroidales bacterium]